MVAIAGTRVTESSAAKAMENVLVHARGEKRRPSAPSSVKTGRKPTVMTRSEKKIGRPTSWSAEMTISLRTTPAAAVSNFLWTFSTTMIAASTIAPMAMAIPPSDMMFAVSPICFMGMKARTTATGRSSAGTRVERKWSRKRRITRVTTISSSISVRRSVSMLRRMRVDRS